MFPYIDFQRKQIIGLILQSFGVHGGIMHLILLQLPLFLHLFFLSFSPTAMTIYALPVTLYPRGGDE